MAVVPSVYPTTLPWPTAAAFQANERRVLGDQAGLRDSRPFSRDRGGAQPVQFVLSTQEEVDTWVAWGKDDLLDWGAWFAADWPLPNGATGVRRFVGAPSYPTLLPNVGWRVSANVRVRGRGELPMLITSNCTEAIAAIEVAQGEIPLVYQYWGADPVPIPDTEGTYVVGGRDPGAVGPGSTFPTSFSVAWDDLADPSTVTLFSTTRVGTGTSGVSLLLTVTDVPSNGVHCKAVLYLNDGHWTNDDGSVPNGAVTVNGEYLGFSTFYPPSAPGTGYLVGSILLRAEGGVLTASLV